MLVALFLGVAGVSFAIFHFGSSDGTPPDTGPMIWVPGGKFTMGSEESKKYPCDAQGCCAMQDTMPLHEVEVDDFWMDEAPVTNAQFARFVEATQFVTQAEKMWIRRPPLPSEVPESWVFSPRPGITNLKDHLQWWKLVPGATWRHPQGPDSNIEGLDDHPVVQVCYFDALEYAKWAGKRLPTEAEFEFAARGGLDQKRFVWGDDLKPDGKWMANIWQGKFPYENTKEDGYEATSPVRAFPPNGYGLYGMSGNVWQWCSDLYHTNYYEKSPRVNPQGPDTSLDLAEIDPETNMPRIDRETGRPVAKRVQRGGSYLCSDQYCKGYMPGVRGKGEPKDAANHIGFRCVRSGK